jgi:SpoVK/Ycf46/Vps4 family AAA+-type ATPase
MTSRVGGHILSFAVVFSLDLVVADEDVGMLQVIELPIKHPELFESLGIAQPKVYGNKHFFHNLQPYSV